jgi:REP element-mobilizing transposase RayT
MVVHFTLHAYRSWRPDNKRGYTRRKKGYLPPDPQQARRYDERAKQDPATFTRAVQKLLIRFAHDFCSRRKMRLHAVGNEEGHSHFVISWKGYSDPHEVMRRLKNVLSTLLNRDCNTLGKRWFVRGGSLRRVTNTAHLDKLIETYLPDHPGIFWCEELPLP